MNGFMKALQRFTGRGEAAITMPPMDGALRPNQLLETAICVAEAKAPDNLAASADGILFSSGRDLIAVGGSVVRSFEAPITATASDGAGGLAVALAGMGIVFLAPDGSQTSIAQTDIRNVTALAFDGPDLLVCEGSSRNAPDEWKRDLMELGFDGDGTGSVWRVSQEGRSKRLAGGLRYPNGIMKDASGRIVVAEAWNHRLVEIQADGGKPKTLLGDLTGYPARMTPSKHGTWLALFAPRSQLIEFVLREDKYRTRMMASMAPDFWIAPTLVNGRSFLEPLQGGGVKQMGVLKPWAPSRSYGLVVLLDADYEPVLSLHSRADGTRHGTTSVLEKDGALYVASRGGDAVVSIDVAELAYS